MSLDFQQLCDRLTVLYGRCELDRDPCETYEGAGHMHVSILDKSRSLPRFIKVISEKPINTDQFISSFAEIMKLMPPGEKVNVKFINYKSEDFSVTGTIQANGDFKVTDKGNFMRVFSLDELDPLEYLDYCATQMIVCRSSPEKWDALLIISERGNGKWNVGLHHFMTGNGTREEFVAAAKVKLDQTELGNIGRPNGPGLVYLDLTQPVEEVEASDV
ncbi:hypothetical protein WKW77_30610 [Variovorax ureilyticus]|uniref:Uncharacterized protein n=1 Tax=Variovorax ureilyticus TaxID=1836198 RepID=A0ABU8VP91_9BURK